MIPILLSRTVKTGRSQAHLFQRFKSLEDGLTIEEIMEQFDVTRQQVNAVLDFAARSLETPART